MKTLRVGSKASLVRQYVLADNSIRGCEIQRRALKEHGVKLTTSTCSEVKKALLASLKKTPKPLMQTPPAVVIREMVKTPPITKEAPGVLEVLNNFVDCVQALGGKEAAKKLLDLLSL